MKLLLLTADRFDLASDCLLALQQSDMCSVVQVILCRRTYASRWQAWRQRARKIRQIGPLGAVVGLVMRRWYESLPHADLAASCVRLGIPFAEVPFTNSEETARLIARCAPDLGLSVGNGYISRRIFQLPKLGMLNVHLERLPEYQNARSVIWPIFFGERTSGLTIHLVNSRIDGGDILLKEEQPIIFHRRFADTVRDTYEALMRRAPAAARYVCENFRTLADAAKPQQNGRKFTTPTVRQFLRMLGNNRRLAREHGTL
jgi:methionyl-tRNA formyltransferase